LINWRKVKVSGGLGASRKASEEASREFHRKEIVQYGFVVRR
jgi:hypothetical protein